jgi:hypothetical protein
VATQPSPDEPGRVGALRGAGVAVDVRRAGRVAVGLVVVGLAVLVVVLFVAGARKNAQITELHAHGVAVEMTVSGCIGLLGGTGSNAAGYSCHGTFTLGGHRYDDQIPGNTLYGPGHKLAGISVASDPALFTTPGTLRTQHASGKVFGVPAVLTVVLALLVVVVVALGRRRREHAAG